MNVGSSRTRVYLKWGKKRLVFYLLHALSNETLQLVVVCFESFLILLLFQSVKCLMWKQISLSLFVFFGKDVRLKLDWWPRSGSASNQMKSLLLGLSCSSHSRCPLFAILCCLPVRLPIIPLPQRKYVLNTNKPGETSTPRETEPCRANVSLGCIDVIMQRFHSSCKANH